MEQYASTGRSIDIGNFVETIENTKDLHLLASLSLRKWAKSLKAGVPDGFEKFQIWLDIREDLEGTEAVGTFATSISADLHTLPVVKQEVIHPTPMKLNSVVPDALDVPLAADLPPPLSRKRRLPPCDVFLSPAANKLNRRNDSPSVTVGCADGFAECEQMVTAEAESDEALYFAHALPKSESHGGSDNRDKDEKQEEEGEFTTRSFSMTSPIPANRAKWTAEQDAELCEIVKLHKNEGWMKVAEMVSSGFSSIQCKRRWLDVLQFGNDLEKQRWSSEEITNLKLLTQQHTIAPHWNARAKSMTKERVDWAAVSKVLNRLPMSCRKKWDEMKRNLPDQMDSVHEEENETDEMETICIDNEPGEELDADVDQGGATSGPSSSYAVHAGVKSSVRWTPEQDERLREGVRLYRAEGWKRIAAFVGEHKNSTQCQSRWYVAMSHLEKGLVRDSSWTDAEVKRLHELVSKHTAEPHWSIKKKCMTQGRIEWTAVGQEMQRVPLDCKNKWNKMKANTASSSDALAPPSDKLQELNSATAAAEDTVCSESSSDEESGSDSETEGPTSDDEADGEGVNVTSSKNMRWTPEEDERLRGAVQLHKDAGWQTVAAFVGNARTSDQCYARWNKVLRYVDNGISKAAWTEEEMQKLPRLVERHVLAPRWNKRLKCMTSEKIDWVTISAELGKIPGECSDKWKIMQAANMKKGPFTEDEDILIRHTVQGWGDKGRGLWMSLQKDLGRPRDCVFKRWKNTLSKQMI